MAVRRIQKEWVALLRDETPLMCHVSPLNEDNLFKWQAFLVGPAGTPYESGIFCLDITFPNNYPFNAPKVMFQTRIFHPNVTENGTICSNFLKNEWSSQHSLSTTLLCINQLLAEPIIDDAVDSYIADMYENDYLTYFCRAKEYTYKYAM